MSRLEIGRTDFDINRSGSEFGMSQPGRHVVGQIAQPAPQSVAVVDVVGEGRFAADRLRFSIRDDTPVILAVRQLPDVASHVPELLDKDFFRETGDLTDGADADRVEAQRGVDEFLSPAAKARWRGKADRRQCDEFRQR